MALLAAMPLPPAMDFRETDDGPATPSREPETSVLRAVELGGFCCFLRGSMTRDRY